MTGLDILVVDDDRELADSLAIFLEIEGHRVALAYNAREALSLYRDERFDLVFLDIRLPDRSGLDCLPELRRLHPGADIILMTAYVVADTLARAREGGALGVVGKPLDVEELPGLLGLLAGGVVPVADETPGFAVRLAEAFAAKGLDAVVVQSVEQAEGAARAGGVDVVILDLTPRALSVSELAGALVDRPGRVPLVVLAGPPSGDLPGANGLTARSVTECIASPRGEAHILERVDRIRKSRA